MKVSQLVNVWNLDLFQMSETLFWQKSSKTYFIILVIIYSNTFNVISLSKKYTTFESRVFDQNMKVNCSLKTWIKILVKNLKVIRLLELKSKTNSFLVNSK